MDRDERLTPRPRPSPGLKGVSLFSHHNRSLDPTGSDKRFGGALPLTTNTPTTQPFDRCSTVTPAITTLVTMLEDALYLHAAHTQILVPSLRVSSPPAPRSSHSLSLPRSQPLSQSSLKQNPSLRSDGAPIASPDSCGPVSEKLGAS